MTASLCQVPNPLHVAMIIAAFAGLSACQSIPEPQTKPIVANPKIPTVQPYQTLDENTISSANQPSIAGQRWQEFYHDARLKQLITLALENNKDIHATILAIQSAKAQYQISDITDVANINGNSSITRMGDFQGNANTRYSVNLASSAYELDFWGRIANLKESALQEYLATTYAKDAAQISLISNIAQNYVAYSYHLAQLKLAEQTLATRLESLKINQQRFQAGLDSELSSVQAQSAVESAKLSIAAAKTNLLKNQNALRYLVGTSIDKNLLPPAGITSVTNHKIFSTGLPSDLLRYRPDIRQAEHKLKAAGANVEVARKAFYPTISLSGNLGVASTDLAQLFKAGSFSWGFGPSINLPIFDGGSRQINYEVKQIVQQQVLNSYEKTIQTAFKEVSDVFASRATLKDQLIANQKMQIANQKNYQIASARFVAGLDNYLGVLDSQRAIFNTEQNILAIKQQQLNSQIQLYQVLGGGANFDVPLDIPKPQHENATTKLKKFKQRLMESTTKSNSEKTE